MNDTRHLHTLKIIFITGLSLLLVLYASGCLNEPYDGKQSENQPPNVWLSSAPPEGSMSKYIIHLYWGGWDPDGEIQYFEYAITDNDSGFFDPADTTGRDKWHRVYSNDSTFTFTADVLEDSSNVNPPMEPVNFVRTHTFLIRAVDMEGLSSSRPAYRSFTAWTLSPEIDVKIPVYNGLNPALLPPITRFSWVAKDYINSTLTSQDPDSVRWILLRVDQFDNDYGKTLNYIRRNPNAPEWHDWVDYKAPDDEGKFWTTPPLEFGAYMFAVQAKDEAGAVTPVFDEARNVRRVIISWRSTGPLLIVRNQYVGTIKSMVENTGLTIVDLPAGTPVGFEWTADAETYGGVVSGYRYGWDINDLKIDAQWAVDWTPFLCEGCEASSPQAVYWFGTHTFHIEVIDNSGFKSRVGVKINFVPFSMENNLLLVDDYNEGDPRTSGWQPSNGAIPNDIEHDAFWKTVLENVADFDAFDGGDIVEVSRDVPLPITKLAEYKSVIWDAYSSYSIVPNKRPFLYSLIRHLSEDPNYTVTGKIYPNLLALFLRAGGHILICGEQPMTAVMNDAYITGPRFPFMFKYELEGDQDGNYNDQIDNPVGDHSFVYEDMCIDCLEIAYTGFASLREHGAHRNGCGVTDKRWVRPKEDGLRECLPIDLDFPLLTLRPEAAGFGKFYALESRGLNNEIYNPPYFRCGNLDIGPRDCFEPIYGHGCYDANSVLYNAPTAAWTSVYGSVVPDVVGGIAARSAVWGFEPVFFDPAAVQEALEVILFNEWQLPRK